MKVKKIIKGPSGSVVKWSACGQRLRVQFWLTAASWWERQLSSTLAELYGQLLPSSGDYWISFTFPVKEGSQNKTKIDK